MFWTGLLVSILAVIAITATGQEDWLSGGSVYDNSRWFSAIDENYAHGGYESNSIYYSYSPINNEIIYLFDGYGQPKGYFSRPKGMFYYYGTDYNNDPWFTQTAVPFLRDGFHYQLVGDKVIYIRQPFWNGPLVDWFGYKAMANWKANQRQHDLFYNKYALPLVQNKTIGQLVVIP